MTRTKIENKKIGLMIVIFVMCLSMCLWPRVSWAQHGNPSGSVEELVDCPLPVMHAEAANAEDIRQPSTPTKQKAYLEQCLAYARKNVGEAIFRGTSVGLGSALVVVLRNEAAIPDFDVAKVISEIAVTDAWTTLNALGVPTGFIYGTASAGFQLGAKPYGDFISRANVANIGEHATGKSLPKSIKSAIDTAEKSFRTYGVEAIYLAATAATITLFDPSFSQEFVFYLAALAMAEQGLMEQTLSEQKNKAIELYPHLTEQIEAFYGKFVSRYAVLATLALIAQILGDRVSDPALKLMFSAPLYSFIGISLANSLFLNFVQKSDITNAVKVLAGTFYRLLRGSKAQASQPFTAATKASTTPVECNSVWSAVWGWRQ